MVPIPNLLVICVTSFYVVYTLDIFVFGQKKVIQEKNEKLDVLRHKSIKTVEEQKEFLSVKANKQPFKWGVFIRRFITFLLVSFGIRFLLNYFSISLKLWEAIVFVMVFPFLYNLVLRQFHLDRDSLYYILK